jgi:hypothetical protein
LEPSQVFQDFFRILAHLRTGFLDFTRSPGKFHRRAGHPQFSRPGMLRFRDPFPLQNRRVFNALGEVTGRGLWGEGFSISHSLIPLWVSLARGMPAMITMVYFHAAAGAFPLSCL